MNMHRPRSAPPVPDWLVRHHTANRAPLFVAIHQNRDATRCYLEGRDALKEHAVVFPVGWFNPDATDVDNYAPLALNVLRGLARRLSQPSPDTTDPAKLAALFIQAGEDLQAAGEEMLAWQECAASERQLAAGSYDPVAPVAQEGAR
jgi:hypothetical protein